jgi:hypothetical protein
MQPVSAVEGDFREMQVVRAPNEPGHEVLTWLKPRSPTTSDGRCTPQAWSRRRLAHWWRVAVPPCCGDGHVKTGPARTQPGPGAPWRWPSGSPLAGRGWRRRGPGGRAVRAEIPVWRAGRTWARLYGWARAEPLAHTTGAAQAVGRSSCNACPATWVRAPGPQAQLSKEIWRSLRGSSGAKPASR